MAIIIDTISPETMNKRDVFRMTSSVGLQKMKEVEGIVVPVACVFYRDERDDGTSTEILSLKMANGNVYATNSKTFIEAFKAILGYFGSVESIGEMEVLHLTSKNGREYLSCAIV